MDKARDADREAARDRVAELRKNVAVRPRSTEHDETKLDKMKSAAKAPVKTQDTSDMLDIIVSEQGFMIAWPDRPEAASYSVMAIMPDFTMRFVCGMKSNGTMVRLPADAVGIVICACDVDGLPVKYSRPSYLAGLAGGPDKIQPVFMESWTPESGKTRVSLSMRHENPCDLYRVYQIAYPGGTRSLMMESELWHVISDGFEPGHTYEIFGYSKDRSGRYVLSAFSGPVACRLGRFEFDDRAEITAVVPVYNAANYLPRLLDSLLMSTFRKIRVVLSDDGSMDGSIEICQWYAETHPGIEIISGPNGGPAVARMRGLAQVRTPWTMLPDADDVVHPDMLAKLYNLALSSGADIAVSRVRALGDIGKLSAPLRPGGSSGDDIVCTYRELVTRYVRRMDNLFFVALWNKIVRTEIYRSLPDNVCPRRHYNDIGYSMTLYSYAEKIAYCPGAVYAWDKRNRLTEGSMSTRGYRSQKAGLLWDAWFGVCVMPLDYGNPAVRQLTEYMALGFLWHYYAERKRAAYVKRFRSCVFPRLSGRNRLIEADAGLKAFLADMRQAGEEGGA